MAEPDIFNKGKKAGRDSRERKKRFRCPPKGQVNSSQAPKGKEPSNSQKRDHPKDNERSRERHPPHLRGREIGMFYAKRNLENREKKQEPKEKMRLKVKLGENKEDRFCRLLNMINLKDEKDVPKSSFTFAYSSHLENDSLDAFVGEGLKRDSKMDVELKRDFYQMQSQPKYRQMQTFREKLPAYQMQDNILKLVESHPVVVLSGETGCGKTTQVAQFILDSELENGNGSLCRIVCTQPRRISAISVAERVANERGEMCNSSGNCSTGWQIRLEKKLPRKRGSILFCTTGIMLQWLKSDKKLENISHIILDEIHERDLDTEFLMIILKDLIQTKNNLKLILMSATLNANSFSKYFFNCPMINIPGFTFPVEELFLEDVLELTQYRPDMSKGQNRGKRNLENDQEPFLRSLIGRYSGKVIDLLRNWNEEKVDESLIISLLEQIALKEKEGAVLVFLTGWDMINNIHMQLSKHHLFGNRSRFLLIPLHSMLTTMGQQEVFNRPPLGVRKVILSTNIAETSVTIDDVVYVIDCGKIKISNFDVERNLSTLNAEWVALSNAKQRRGRAGRVQPGKCYHLYTKHRESQLEQYCQPEILRTRLETLCLKIKILNMGLIELFLSKSMSPPTLQSVQISIKLLRTLDALDDEECLTPLGFHLARLPLDPQTGKMILFGAIFSCLDPILTIAASLSFKDAFVFPLGKESLVDKCKKELGCGSYSDHLMLSKVYKDWEIACSYNEDKEFCHNNFLSWKTLKMLKDLRSQFAQYLTDLKFLHCSNLKHPDFNQNSDNDKLLKAIICAGLYPNVVNVRQKKSKFPLLYTENDGKVNLHPRSINSTEKYFPFPWLVYYQKMKSSSIFLHDTTMVSPYPLLFFGGKLTKVKDKGQEVLIIDKSIEFNCSSITAYVLMELRKELEKLLQFKIEHPEAKLWEEDSRWSLGIKGIVELISSEAISL